MPHYVRAKLDSPPRRKMEGSDKLVAETDKEPKHPASTIGEAHHLELGLRQIRQVAV